MEGSTLRCLLLLAAFLDTSLIASTASGLLDLPYSDIGVSKGPSRRLLEDRHNAVGSRRLDNAPKETCTKGEFTCKNGDIVSWLKKCDGTKNCADGSDEDSKLCDGSSSSLKVGETVTATMDFDKSHDSLRFSFCDAKSCDSVMVLGFDARGKLAAESWLRCNRWGVICQKGDWLTTDVKMPLKAFIPHKLSIVVQHKPTSVVLWLKGNAADSVSLSIPEGVNRLRVSANICEGQYLMPVTFSKSCGKGEFTCKNGNMVSWLKKCDGTKNCADGSDEDSKLCDGSSTSLMVGETVTATMDFDKSHDSLRFSFCDAKSCDSVMVLGFDARGNLAAESWLRCNRWGVICQKGDWLTTDVKMPLKGFTPGELSFVVQHRPFSMVLRLEGNAADSVSLSIPEGINRLRVSANLCEGQNMMPVTFTKNTCGKGEFRCRNGRKVSWLEKCDGTRNCADGSDEDPDLCDGPSTPLMVGETVTATMDFAKSYDSLRFSLCNAESCDTVMMMGYDSSGKLVAESWPRCNRWGVNCQDSFWLTTDIKMPLKDFTPGELSFVVQHKPFSMVLWLKGNAADSVSLSIPEGSNRLRVSALTCEGRDLMPVTYVTDDGCGEGDFKCAGDGRNIDYAQKCDGTKNCVDGSDEDPKLCDEPTTVLAEGQTVTATVNFKKRFQALRFSLCSPTNCETIMVQGLDSYGALVSDGFNNCNKWGVRCTNRFSLTQGKVERLSDLLPGEINFMVQRQVKHMVVWLKANPYQNLTMEVPEGRYRLRISALRCEGNLLMPVKYSVGVSALGSGHHLEEPSSQLVSPSLCGISPPNVSTRIKGGTDATASEFPWHVGLYVLGKYNCGGSLLADRIVVTAAHCVFNDKNQLFDRQQLQVTVGNTYRDWSRGNTDGVQRRNVSRIYPHEQYRGTDRRFGDDIAILELAISFIMGPTVVAICIDSTGYVLPALTEKDVGMVPGWGKTKTEQLSSSLQSAELPYIPFDKCYAEAPKDFLQYLSADKICAGFINGTAVANGDSGGGLVFKNDGRWYLQGIVSIGHQHVLTYGAFTKVSNFIPWINSVVRRITSLSFTYR